MMGNLTFLLPILSLAAAPAIAEDFDLAGLFEEHCLTGETVWSEGQPTHVILNDQLRLIYGFDIPPRPSCSLELGLQLTTSEQFEWAERLTPQLEAYRDRLMAETELTLLCDQSNPDAPVDTLFVESSAEGDPRLVYLWAVPSIRIVALTTYRVPPNDARLSGCGDG